MAKFSSQFFAQPFQTITSFSVFTWYTSSTKSLWVVCCQIEFAVVCFSALTRPCINFIMFFADFSACFSLTFLFLSSLGRPFVLRLSPNGLSQNRAMRQEAVGVVLTWRRIDVAEGRLRSWARWFSDSVSLKTSAVVVTEVRCFVCIFLSHFPRGMNSLLSFSVCIMAFPLVVRVSIFFPESPLLSRRNCFWCCLWTTQDFPLFSSDSILPH